LPPKANRLIVPDVGSFLPQFAAGFPQIYLA
jgi:hypothetical protein